MPHYFHRLCRNRHGSIYRFYFVLSTTILIIWSYRCLKLPTDGMITSGMHQNPVSRPKYIQETTQWSHYALPLTAYDYHENVQYQPNPALQDTFDTDLHSIDSRATSVDRDSPATEDERVTRISLEDTADIHRNDDTRTAHRYTADASEYFSQTGQSDDQLEHQDPGRILTEAGNRVMAIEDSVDAEAVDQSIIKLSTQLLSVGEEASKATESSDDLQIPIQPLEEMYAWSEGYTFPQWDECLAVKERADNLPDLLHVTFEQSVQDVVLDGWEDVWVAKARYIGPKLQEPKIDFVYNCE